MNKNDIQQIKKIVAEIKLSEEKKSAMLNAILSSKKEALSPALPVASPYLRYIPSLTFKTSTSSSRILASSLIAILITTSGATSAFAELSLPGDPLYVIKKDINEPIVGLLAVTKESNLKWQEKLTERRLDEARLVVDKGTLNEETRKVIEDNVTKQVETFAQAAENYVATKHETEDRRDVEEITFKVEATLRAHQDIINRKNKLTKIAKEEKIAAISEKQEEPLVYTNLAFEDKAKIVTENVPVENEEDELIKSLKKQEVRIKESRTKARPSNMEVTRLALPEPSLTSSSLKESASQAIESIARQKLALAEKALTKIEKELSSTEKREAYSTSEAKDMLAQAKSALLRARTSLDTHAYEEVLLESQNVLTLTNDVKVLLLSKEIVKKIEKEAKENTKNNTKGKEQRGKEDSKENTTRDRDED